MAESPFPPETVERVQRYLRRRAAGPREGVVDVVRGSQAKLMALIADVDDERAAARPPGDGEWGLGDLIRHVIAAEETVADMVQAMCRGETPRDLDGSRDDGGQVEDDSPFPALVARLRRANERMIGAIEGIPEAPDVGITPSHMWFGPLNCVEWAVFQHIHDEDHVQHAQKILNATQ